MKKKRRAKRSSLGTRQRNVARSNQIDLLRFKSEGKRVSLAESFVSTRFTPTGVLELLNGIAAGTTASTRLGRLINLHALEIAVQAMVFASSSELLAGRLMVVYDKAPNKAALTTAMLFETTTLQCSAINYDNRWRFQVLLDLVFCAGPSAPITLHECIDLLGLVTSYSNNAGTIASITSGALYLFTVGDNGLGTPEESSNLSLTLCYRDD